MQDASFLLLLAVTITAFATAATGARILALLPFAAKSHHIFHQAILKALALRGHQVVVYSSFPQKNPLPNYVDVQLNSSFSDDYVTYEMIIELMTASPIGSMTMLWEEMEIFNEGTYKHENFKKLVNSNEKFDLVITETFFGQELNLGFGYKFNAPTITLHPFGVFGPINSVMGNSHALSYIPDTSFPFSDHMTFYERLVSSYSIISTLYSYHYKYMPRAQANFDRHFKFPKAPSVADIVHNISLVFVNAHPTIHYARPLSPNIVPIGGIHVSKDRKPLPQDIQKFMDEAKFGVILFSFGSIVPDHLMPAEYFQKFVRVFKKLPQRVLWKTRSKSISDLPSNVMTGSWMPQQDILAHPNCQLFMTHGGLLSLLEAVYAGVPVVGTPFYGDQSLNVKYYEQIGIGTKLDFLTLSEESIFKAVTTVLDNLQYKENARKLSRIFRDVPMSQTDSAVYWVEYVLKHGGAPHLRPAATQVAWYQLYLLDVLAAILAVAVATVLTLYLVCRKILRCTFGAKATNYSTKKTN